jgi:hypothetical protein
VDGLAIEEQCSFDAIFGENLENSGNFTNLFFSVDFKEQSHSSWQWSCRFVMWNTFVMNEEFALDYN